VIQKKKHKKQYTICGFFFDKKKTIKYNFFLLTNKKKIQNINTYNNKRKEKMRFFLLFYSILPKKNPSHTARASGCPCPQRAEPRNLSLCALFFCWCFLVFWINIYFYLSSPSLRRDDNKK